jgi:uncharacterized protein YjbJ (UPF0337 family)
VGRKRGKTSGEDKREGAVDKAKGRLKEATWALTGDEVRKSESRSDQRKGTLREKKDHLKDLFEWPGEGVARRKGRGRSSALVVSVATRS